MFVIGGDTAIPNECLKLTYDGPSFKLEKIADSLGLIKSVCTDGENFIYAIRQGTMTLRHVFFID